MSPLFLARVTEKCWKPLKSYPTNAYFIWDSVTVRNQTQVVKMCSQLQDLDLFWSGQGAASQVVILVLVQTQVQNWQWAGDPV